MLTFMNIRFISKKYQAQYGATDILNPPVSLICQAIYQVF